MSAFKAPNTVVPVESATGGSPSPMDVVPPSPEETSESFGIATEEYNRTNSYYFNQISNLFREQLYSNVLTLGGILSTLAEKLKGNILTEWERTQIAMLCGDSAFNLHDYPRAETFYKNSIQMYSSYSKGSLYFKDHLPTDFLNDAKYKVYLCQMQCKKPAEALNTLQNISAKHRSVRINMALGKLYLQSGLERTATTCFKEVLKKCPMAMDAIESLMSLGLKVTDIQNIVQKRNQEIVNIEWFNSWLKGSCAFQDGDFGTALNVYSHLQEKTALLNNHRLLIEIGKTHAMTGAYTSGITPLQVAHGNDPTNFTGMEFLSFLLWTEKRTLDLEKLAFKLMEYNYTETKSEPYIAMAYYCQLTNRNSKALQFAEKAVCIQGVKNPEALICKANIYMEMQYYQNALPCFREASIHFPKRFEAQKGIFECYMATNRFRDAMAISTAFLKLELSPRVLTMCAFPLTKEALTLRKAKAYLDKALKIDSGFLPAVFLSVDILEEDGQFAAAVKVLMKLIDSRPPPSVHNRLGDLLVKMGKEDKAADHFNISLKLDPENRTAIEGLSKLDQSSRPMDNSNSSTVEVEEITSDENEDGEEQPDLENLQEVGEEFEIGYS